MLFLMNYLLWFSIKPSLADGTPSCFSVRWSRTEWKHVKSWQCSTCRMPQMVVSHCSRSRSLSHHPKVPGQMGQVCGTTESLLGPSGFAFLLCVCDCVRFSLCDNQPWRQEIRLYQYWQLYVLPISNDQPVCGSPATNKTQGPQDHVTV